MALHKPHRLSAAAVLLLTACANVPSLNYVGRDRDNDGVTVGTLVSHIQCELWKADNFSKLAEQNYRAQVTLTLKVEDNAGLSPSLSFIEPYSTPSTSLTYAIGGTLNVNRQRIFTNQYTIDLAKLRNKLTRDSSSCVNPSSTTFNLTGDLGIGGIIAGGLDTATYQDVNVDTPSDAPPQKFSFNGAVANKKTVTRIFKGNVTQELPPRSGPHSQPPSFGSTVQFMITKSINAGPNWVLEHFKGPNGSSGIVGAGRIDTDTMIIAFAPGSNISKKANLTAQELREQQRSNESAQNQVQSLTTNMILQNLGTLR